MAEFVTNVTTLISGIFNALVDALGSIGDLVFKTATEGGAITGLTGFGTLLVIGISIPLATWLFGKIFTWLKGFARAGR